MRARVVFCCVVAAVAATALVSASDAATTKMPQLRIDLSTRAAVIQYLRSIHVSPVGLVIQRGSHNYAGAGCPGQGWSCTTTQHTVVQIAPAHGRNTFSCATAKCAVVQYAPATPVNNTASCIKTAGLTQTCSITQTNASGGDNTAIVYEKATTSAGMTQTTKSTATITQQSTSGSNTACVYQETGLTNSTATNGTVILRQESHQSVTVKQDSTGGNNSAAFSATAAGACDLANPITQNQTLTSTDSSTGHSVTQEQNAVNHGANVTIDIEQNQGVANGFATGTNAASFVQNSTLTAIANSPIGISQTQSSVNGGLLGTINQDSSGGSTANTEQHEIQCEDAATAGLTSCDQADPDAAEAPASLTQIQYGPVRKGLGTSTQTRGGAADTFTIDQTSQQDSDQGSGSSQTEDVEGDCLTDGNCTVTQAVTENGFETDNFATGQDVDATISCSDDECLTGGGEENPG